jgi:hypothetical protein
MRLGLLLPAYLPYSKTQCIHSIMHHFHVVWGSFRTDQPHFTTPPPLYSLLCALNHNARNIYPQPPGIRSPNPPFSSTSIINDHWPVPRFLIRDNRGSPPPTRQHFLITLYRARPGIGKHICRGKGIEDCGDLCRS